MKEIRGAGLFDTCDVDGPDARICGGKNDEPLPSSLPGRAVAGPSSLGSYANALSGAASSTKLPPYTTR